MTLWKFKRESTHPATGANNVAGVLAGFQIIEESVKKGKRNVIATAAGWVRRQNKTDMHAVARQFDEILVASHPGSLGVSYASNTYLGNPDIVQVYMSSNSTGGTALQRSLLANVYVVFNEPIRINGSTGKGRLSFTNTVSGNAQVATSNNTNGGVSVINANNTVVFKFKPGVAGTYKVSGQAIVNATATAVAWVSRNTGNETANLTITGAVSNTGFCTFTVRSATTGG